MFRHVRFFAVVPFVLCIALTAEAQDERARLHLQAGASYYEAGDYNDALREFQRAHALSGRSELFYNFALCFQQLGDLDNAALYLRRYLDEVPNIENREQLERRHANLLERIAAREADPSTQPVFRFEFDDAERDAGAAPSPTDPSTADGPAESDGVPVGAVVGYSVAGVGAVLAVTLGALALRERADIEDGCGATRTCSSSQVQRMDGLALGADIGLGVMLVGATVGTILLLTGRGGDEVEESDQQARVRFAPYATPTAAGATLRGTF